MAGLDTVTLSAKGQLVIPKYIREKLNLKKGDTLLLAFDDSRLLVEKTTRSQKKIHDDFVDLIHASHSSTGFWDNDIDEVWEHV